MTMKINNQRNKKAARLKTHPNNPKPVRTDDLYNKQKDKKSKASC